MRKSLIFVLILSWPCVHIPAQEPTRCNTTMDLAWLQANAPSRYQNFIDLENFTTNYINNQGQNTNRLINPNGDIIIPVIVHVLHYGEPIGSGFNISMARIESQIEVINKDFRRLNADAVNTPSAFLPLAADFNIEFRLACIDPAGNPTDGVIRTQTNAQYFLFDKPQRADGSTNEEAIGIKTLPYGSPSWPTERYLNIWVCNMLDVAGYAQFPADYALYPQYDGVVVSKTSFGNPSEHIDNNKGRTLTHEIGHWLNLIHIWGDVPKGSNNYDCLLDDFVGDTPQQKDFTFSPSNNGCPNYPDLIKRCDASDPSTMFMNYMDQVKDNCYNMFSNGQKLRARALFATVGLIPGPRVSQLNNWFKVRQSKIPIRCSGVVYSSAACLSTSWTVLSGPATLTPGPGVNQATLTATGTGTVVIRATSGNYTTDDNIEVTNVPPAAQGYYYYTANNYSCPGCQNGLGPYNTHMLPAGQSGNFNVNITNGNELSNIQWANSGSYQVSYVANGGALSFYMVAGPGAYTTRTTTFTLTAQTSCGTINQGFNFSIVTQGWGYRIVASPNPAKNMLHVIEKRNGLKQPIIDKNVTMELIEISTGRKIKQWMFSGKQKEFNLDIRGIKSGQYILIVRRGKDQDSKQIMIE